ncbi:hypothetical protein BDW71DRAFT_79467 [Aspergillus fruticulosus]
MRSSDDISGRQIDAPGLLGQTPLHLSVQNVHLSVAERQLAAGADQSRSNNLKEAALYHACESQHSSLAIC